MAFRGKGLFVLILVCLQWPLAAEVAMVAAASPEGITLLWQVSARYKNSELLLYRKRPDRRQRRLLTEKPLRRARTAEDLKKYLGPEDFKKLQPPGKNLPEAEIIKTILSDDSFIEIAGFYYPRLGEALAMRFFDRLVVRPKRYTYWLVAKTPQGERTLASVSVNSGRYPRVATPKKPAGSVENQSTFLNWPPVDDRNIIGYNIYRNRFEKGDYRKVNKVPLAFLNPEKGKSRVHFEDNTIKKNKTYWYYITAVHFSGLESKPSAKLRVRSITRPAPPEILKVSLRKDGKIILRWKTTSKAEIAFFEIYRSRKRDGKYKRINQLPVPANALSYEDEINDLGGSYWYRIKALNRMKSASDFSAAISCQLKRLIKPPGPLKLTATIVGDQIELRWQPIKDKLWKNYQIERASRLKGKFYTQKRIRKNIYRDKTAQPGETYYYRVAYNDNTGVLSEYSKVVNIRNIDRRPPIAPLDLLARQQQSHVILTWQPVTSPQLAGYQLQFRTNFDKKYKKLHKKLLNSSTASYRHRLWPGVQTVAYRIFGVSRQKIYSEKSAHFELIVKAPSMRPPRITLVQPTWYKKKKVLAIYWQKITHHNFIGYDLYRRAAGSASFRKVNLKTIDKENQVFFDTAANPDGYYSYYLVIKNANQKSRSQTINYDGR